MLTRTSSLLSLALAGALCAPTATQSVPGPEVRDQVEQALSVRDAHLAMVRKLGTVGTPLVVAIDTGADPIVLSLQPYSVRGPNYAAFEQRDDGSLVPLPPEPVRTYRGTVVGDPNSEVAGSWMMGGLWARVIGGQGDDYWIQPVAPLGVRAGSEWHALYQTRDVIMGAHSCGTDNSLRIAPQDAGVGGPSSSTARTAGTAELGIDTDYEYYRRWGSNTRARIESVINTMNRQYQNEVGITHVLGRVIIRSNSSDPYKSRRATRMLAEVRRAWRNVSGPRDVVQMFTGKDISGGTIGIAYLGTVCNLNYGFSVVQSDFNNNFSCATDLSAHELGHTWNAGHCSCRRFTMNAFITCANTFSAGSRNTIIAFRNSRRCLN